MNKNGLRMESCLHHKNEHSDTKKLRTEYWPLLWNYEVHKFVFTSYTNTHTRTAI